MIEFPPHGTFSINLSNNIVIARLSDSWNEETAIAFKNDFIQTALPLTGKPWGHLVYLDDWNLGATEVTPVMSELVKWCLAHNLHRAAHVYTTSMVKKYYIETMIVEQEGNFVRQAFSDERQAIQWLGEAGFIF